MNPFVTPSGVAVRCGSRVKSRCEPCSELYRKDWAAIGRSGVFDGDAQNFSFFLLTLTAPSFGAVHRVPRSGKSVRCKCGVFHSLSDGALRGVPLDFESYDYAGQGRFNRDAGVLWDRTRRRLRDSWDTLEYFLVREWQDRGVLHVHVLIRIPRAVAPSAEELGERARSADAFSPVDGSELRWGKQSDCQVFKPDADGAATIKYLSKMLNYVLKDMADAGEGVGHPLVMRHHQLLGQAALEMRCGVECAGESCANKLHQRFGARSQVVQQSRRTKNRPGWSFTGLNRTVQRRMRMEWVRSQMADAAAEQSQDAGVVPVDAVVDVVKLLRELLGAVPLSVP